MPPVHVHIDEVVVSGLSESERRSVALGLPAHLEQLLSTVHVDVSESQRFDVVESELPDGRALGDSAQAVAASLHQLLTDHLGGAP
jgi:hypothetical protein